MDDIDAWAARKVAELVERAYMCVACELWLTACVIRSKRC